MALDSFLCSTGVLQCLTNPLIILPEPCRAPITAKRVIVAMLLEYGGRCFFTHFFKLFLFIHSLSVLVASLIPLERQPRVNIGPAKVLTRWLESIRSSIFLWSMSSRLLSFFFLLPQVCGHLAWYTSQIQYAPHMSL
jgi:hypothetical protein